MNEEYAKALETPTVAWVPQKDENQPRSIIGRVIDTYTTTSDYTSDPVPVVLVEDTGANDGTGVEWVVKGYAKGLRGQIERQQPHVGDLVGIGYQGRADETNNESAHRYKVRVFERVNREPAAQDAGSDATPAANDATPAAEDDDVPQEADDGIPF